MSPAARFYPQPQAHPHPHRRRQLKPEQPIPESNATSFGLGYTFEERKEKHKEGGKRKVFFFFHARLSRQGWWLAIIFVALFRKGNCWRVTQPNIPRLRYTHIHLAARKKDLNASRQTSSLSHTPAESSSSASVMLNPLTAAHPHPTQPNPTQTHKTTTAP